MLKRVVDIRDELSGNLGKSVKLVSYESRNRVTERQGKLTNTYPSIFIVEIAEEQDSVNRVSYNYIDVLTGTVELNFT